MRTLAPDLGFNNNTPVVDGTVNGYTGVTVSNGAIFVTGSAGASTAETAVVRKLTSAGAFDATFNGGNAVSVPLGAANAGHGYGVLSAGTSIAVAGNVNPSVTVAGQAAVAAVAQDGSVNAGFGTTDITYGAQAGLFSPQFQYSIMSHDCQGRLLLSTTLVTEAGLDDAGEDFQETVISRVLQTGGLDTTFGTGGSGLTVGLNSSPGAAPIQDPVTGGIVVIVRRRGGVGDGQIGLVRLRP